MVGDGRLTPRFARRGFALNASRCSISAPSAWGGVAPSNCFGSSHLPLRLLDLRWPLPVVRLSEALAKDGGRWQIDSSLRSSGLRPQRFALLHLRSLRMGGVAPSNCFGSSHLPLRLLDLRWPLPVVRLSEALAKDGGRWQIDSSLRSSGLRPQRFALLHLRSLRMGGSLRRTASAVLICP